MFSTQAPHWVPLRSAGLPRQGQERAQNLLEHHYRHHPHEGSLEPVTAQGQHGYYLNGHFVPVCNADQPSSLGPKRISEVAAIALSQLCGTGEELFYTEWGPPEDTPPGGVFWNTREDKICGTPIIPPSGKPCLLEVNGSSVTDAEACFLAVHRSLQREHLQTVPRGIGSVTAVINGGTCRSWEGSPVHLELCLPDPDKVTPEEFQEQVNRAIDQAIANRL